MTKNMMGKRSNSVIIQERHEVERRVGRDLDGRDDGLARGLTAVHEERAEQRRRVERAARDHVEHEEPQGHGQRPDHPGEQAVEHDVAGAGGTRCLEGGCSIDRHACLLDSDRTPK
jgi:hypothetical protein